MTLPALLRCAEPASSDRRRRAEAARACEPACGRRPGSRTCRSAAVAAQPRAVPVDATTQPEVTRHDRPSAHRRGHRADPRAERRRAARTISTASHAARREPHAARPALLRQPRPRLRRLRRRPTRRRSRGDVAPNLGIITAYNDMLSAHQPYEPLPRPHQGGGARGRRRRRRSPAACRRCATASRRAQTGMELSLFSRDTIAMAAAIGLSHDMFDAAVFLGICDKIVPGLLIAALTFGHLPAVFIPAGPMPSGMSNAGALEGPPALCRGQDRPRRAARSRGEVLSTRPAPAPSTAPPTPTRC